MKDIKINDVYYHTKTSELQFVFNKFIRENKLITFKYLDSNSCTTIKYGNISKYGFVHSRYLSLIHHTYVSRRKTP